MTKFAIDDRLDNVDIHLGGRFDPRHLGSYLCPMEELRVELGGILGGFKWSSQHRLCSLTTAIRQAPLLAFSNPKFFAVGH
jgi:hypothetical protein